MHFCFYQKNYEQQRKKGIPLEDCPIINRYELRFRHEKAQALAHQLVSNRDFETIIFELINHSLCFYDRPPDQEGAKIDPAWAHFIGNHGELSLTLKSNPMTLEKSIRWLIQSVAPTMKLITLVGEAFGIDLLSMIVDTGELSDGTQKILDTVCDYPEWYQEEIQLYVKELQEKQKSKALPTQINAQKYSALNKSSIAH